MNRHSSSHEHPFTDLLPRFPCEVQDTILLLGITMSTRFDAASIDQWRHRMQAHLAAVGLVAAIAPSRVAVLAVGRPLTETDRGVVLGWLVAQPEVVFVHIERRTTRRVSIGCARPAQVIELAGGVEHGRP